MHHRFTSGGTSVLAASRFSLASSSPAFLAGGHGGAAIPVPVPNTEVKGSFAEGSAGLARARVGRRRLFPFHEIRPKGGRRGPQSGPAFRFLWYTVGMKTVLVSILLLNLFLPVFAGLPNEEKAHQDLTGCIVDRIRLCPGLAPVQG